MSLNGLSRKVKRRAQPQGGSQIDWSNPITKGLVLCTHAGVNFVELTTRKQSTITSATQTTTTKGKAFSNSATTYSIETPVNGSFGEAVTWVVGAEIASFGGGGLGRFADKRTAASATQVELFYVNQPTTNIQFQRVTNSVTQTIGSASGLSFPAPFAAYAVTVSSITAADGTIYINGNRTNDNTRNMDGKIAFAYRWNRVLSAKEVALISNNPYQLFKPINTIVFVSSGTISRPNSDIAVSGWTSSDAQPLYTDIDEVTPSDTDYIYSPGLTGTASAATFGLTLSLSAGAYDVSVRARQTNNTSQIRVVLKDSGGTSVGATGWQLLTGSYATYTLPITITGTAVQASIEAKI